MFRSIPFKIGCGMALAWGLILLANAAVRAQSDGGAVLRPALPNQVRVFPLQPIPQPLSNQPFNFNLGQLGGMFGQLGQFGNQGQQGMNVNGNSFNMNGFVGVGVIGFNQSGSANQLGGLLLGNVGIAGGFNGQNFQGVNGGVNGFNTGTNLGNMNVGMFGAQGAGGFVYLPQAGPNGYTPGVFVFANISQGGFQLGFQGGQLGGGFQIGFT